jgi:hypothetical protein
MKEETKTGGHHWFGAYLYKRELMYICLDFGFCQTTDKL